MMKNLRNWAALIALTVFVAGAAALEAQSTGWLSLSLNESSGAVQARNLNLYGAPVMIGRGTAAPTVDNSGAPPMEGELYVITADSTEPRLQFYSNNQGAFTSILNSTLATNAVDIANSIWFSSNQINFEGATANAAEAILTVEDIGVDLTFEFVNRAGAGTVQILDTGLPPLLTNVAAAQLELPDTDYAPRSINQPQVFKHWFRMAPVWSVAVPTTAGAQLACATGSGAVNYLTGMQGLPLTLTTIGASTLCGVTWSAADGLKLSGDDADNEGFELNYTPMADGPTTFTIGTSPAFYFKVRFALADITAADEMFIGFRADGVAAAAYLGYTDIYGIGLGELDDTTSGDDWWQQTEINDAGSLVATDIAETDVTNNQVHTVTVLVGATGVVTAEIEGALVSTTAYTFDDTDEVVPFIRFISQTTNQPEMDIVFMEVGLQ